ncbi:hypothetical protein [Bradyrhizobium sp. dw_78]|uniref:His-rich protein BRANT n=1 Tax=Bradyrhizobium sp. dw_78 TaxID=2719793 RepID=UPI001BD1EED6|nr:hypothetical protein [Bradyrhizobium sp. dw_78]
MLKTISAALLAVAVLAAPAVSPAAAATVKTTHAPAVRTGQMKPSVLNANAKMERHHRKHYRHHRFHKKIGALKTHEFSKVTAKHVTLPVKRG